MHVHRNLPSRAFWLAPLALAAACGDDDPMTGADAGPRDFGGVVDSGVPDESLIEVASGAGLTSFVGAVQTASLTAQLSRPGPFTVFAPSEAAFSSAGTLPSDPDLLANVLLHHVLPFESRSEEVLASRSLRSSSGLRLPVDASASPPTVGGAALGMLDLPAGNGVLHTIESVLLPPSIPELVGADTRTATLAATLSSASASVRGALAAPGPITVFAPVNEAFSRVDLNAIGSDPAFLDSLLQFHVTQGHVLKDELSNGQTVTMANGQTLTVRVLPGDELLLVDAQSRTARIVQEDVRLLNGVVHLVDRVLFPSRNAVDLVETLRRNNLNSAATAIMAAGLTDTLAMGGPFTVFAPTDAAFAAFGMAAPTDPALIANVLLNHVVAGSRTTQALERTATLPTVAGPNLIFDFGSDPPTVNGSGLTETSDQIATNGIVHAIDRVIVPPRVSGAPRLFSSLSTFDQAVQAASESIRDTLSGPGPVTVFAPVNSAFTGIDVPALAMDQGRLDEILALHVASGQLLSTDLQDGQTITMSGGLNLTVRRGPNGVTLVDGTGNTARVTQADVRLRNGVVHLIDGVLSPGHLVEQARTTGLTSLLAAVTRAELSTTLRTGGPFTLFAPSNAAFIALGLDLDMLRPEVVENILSSHVVPGSVGSSSVLMSSQLTSLGNLQLAVTSTMGATRVGGARLSAMLDISAANGLLHVLEDVIVPPRVSELAARTPDLSVLVTALDRASALTRAVVDPDVLTTADRPVTVLAPVNSAFTAQGIDPSMMTAAQLDPVLGHHVITGQLLSSGLRDGQRVRAQNGTLTFNVAMDGTVSVTDGQGNRAQVLTADLRTLNGVVYLIDRVLLP